MENPWTNKPIVANRTANPRARPTGCALKRHKRASSTAVSILLGTYFLSIVVDLNKDWESLKYLSPFKYFNPVELMSETSFDPLYIAIAIGIVVISMTGAYLTYARRDLYI